VLSFPHIVDDLLQRERYRFPRADAGKAGHQFFSHRLASFPLDLPQVPPSEQGRGEHAWPIRDDRDGEYNLRLSAERLRRGGRANGDQERESKKDRKPKWATNTNADPTSRVEILEGCSTHGAATVIDLGRMMSAMDPAARLPRQKAGPVQERG
jgi:hypothetical protein